MATLARVLAFAVVLTLASAIDQWGMFGCPDFRWQAVGIPYTNATAMTSYITDLKSQRGPLTLVAAAESEEAAQFSCIVLDPSTSEVQFYKNGISDTAPIDLDTTTGLFKGTLPQGLLGVPDAINKRTWTIVSDKEGVIVMKTCKGAFLSHFTSTYVFVDNSVDASSLDMRCLIPAIDKALWIISKPKGVCPSGMILPG